jgi:hypothetical protein
MQLLKVLENIKLSCHLSCVYENKNKKNADACVTSDGHNSFPGRVMSERQI